ncbi:MAG: twin-arginine translocation signal domain-containing protein [Luteitalea sp.]|nr:twin-arginine translocation signal domain-containing protein [Luteitalea sp.]
MKASVTRLFDRRDFVKSLGVVAAASTGATSARQPATTPASWA